jgi:hypothetical protein
VVRASQPVIDRFNYSKWPIVQNGESEVEFHLVYQGELPAAGQGGGKTRTREKQEMRKVFHKQLVNLWSTQSFLKSMLPVEIKELGNRYARCGFRFVPLISDYFTVAAALDILFLRRDGPGSIVRSGGDIDNRIKVLFDALRMPQTCDELCGDSPGPDEEPFFCLLEDDKLISKVQIETNWLLTPVAPNERLHDVQLVIRVNTVASGAPHYTAAFFS